MFYRKNTALEDTALEDVILEGVVLENVVLEDVTLEDAALEGGAEGEGNTLPNTHFKNNILSAKYGLQDDEFGEFGELGFWENHLLRGSLSSQNAYSSSYSDRSEFFLNVNYASNFLDDFIFESNHITSAIPDAAPIIPEFFNEVKYNLTKQGGGSGNVIQSVVEVASINTLYTLHDYAHNPVINKFSLDGGAEQTSSRWTKNLDPYIGHQGLVYKRKMALSGFGLLQMQKMKLLVLKLKMTQMTAKIYS